MGKSFFLTQNYSQLRNASQVFCDLIVAAPTSYGLTAPLAASYQTLNNSYVAKFLLADAPETRTKVTILDRNNAAIALKANAAELAGIIEHTATVTDGQKAALGLSVRATPAPMPPPGTCSNFKIQLLGDGSVQSTWKANNPPGMNGVTYQVWRRLGSEGEFVYVGACGEKKYIDTTIPAGTQQVQYQIRGIRPTGAGAAAQFNVNFGTPSGGGTTIASVTESKPVKLAA